MSNIKIQMSISDNILTFFKKSEKKEQMQICSFFCAQHCSNLAVKVCCGLVVGTTCPKARAGRRLLSTARIFNLGVVL